MWTSFVVQCPLVEPTELLCIFQAHTVERSMEVQNSKYLTELGVCRNLTFQSEWREDPSAGKEGIVGSTMGTKGSTADADFTFERMWFYN